MKITITEEQLRILTERNLTNNRPNIGIGGTMALIGVRTVATAEENELEVAGIMSEKQNAECEDDDGCPKKGECCYTAQCLPCNKVPGKNQIRRSDSDRLRRRPYSPKARFRATPYSY